MLDKELEEYLNSLEKIHFPDGSSLLGKINSISKFYKQKISAETFKKYISSPNSPFFGLFEQERGPDWFIEVLEYGNIGIEQLARIAETGNLNGQLLFNPYFDINPYAEFKGNIDDVISLLNLMNSEQAPVFGTLPDYYKHVYDNFYFDPAMSAIELINLGHSRNEIESLISLRSGNETVFSNYLFVHEFLVNGGTLDFAKRLLELKNGKGSSIFTGEDMMNAAIYKLELDYIEFISKLSTEDGKLLYTEGMGVINLFEHIKNKKLLDYKEIIQKLSQVKQIDGTSFFKYGRDITYFLRNGGTIDLAETYSKLKNSQGSQMIQGYEAAMLVSNKVPIGFIREFSGNGVGGNEITFRYLWKIGAKGITFDNSAKPKALILLPDYEYESMHALDFLANRNELQKILDSYNFRFRTFKTTEDIGNLLIEDPDIDLVIVKGHGNSEEIYLSSHMPRYQDGISMDDRYLAKSTFSKLANGVNGLKFGATFYFDACLTAEGRSDNPNNLVNQFHHEFPHIRVIGASQSFIGVQVKVKHIFPIQIQIGPHAKLNCAYSIGPDENYR